jgi:hypothetical protein
LICKRTRSNYPLKDKTLDDLEILLNSLPLDEEEYLFEDDEEEYQKFLAMVNLP